MRFLALIALILPAVSWSQVTTQPSPPCAKPPMAIPVGSNINLVWTAPTTNTDGSAISGTITYNLYSLNGTNPTLVIGGLTSALSARTNLAAGTPCYAVTAIVGGVESALSNTAAVWVAQIPAAPKTMTCTVTIPGNTTTSPSVVCSTQ